MTQKRNPVGKTAETKQVTIPKSALLKELYVYDLDGILKKQTTIGNYIKEAKTTYNSINLAVTSYKNYGYINNKRANVKEFVSLTPITKFYTADEVMDIFAKWIRKRFPYHLKNFAKVYKTDTPDDVNDFASLALQYIMKTIRMPESNNNFESSLIYKYKMCRLDVLRARDVRKKHGEVSDFNVKNSTGDKVSFISNYGNRSVYDNGDVHNCVADENYSKQIESIGLILKQYVEPAKVDFFLTCIEWQDFDFGDKPVFKSMTLVRRYKEHIAYLMTICPADKTMSKTDYVELVIEECWNAIKHYKEEIIDIAKSNVYKDFDDLELADFNSGVSHLRNIENAFIN